MSVHIYVEGGGDQRATSAALREGFAAFFKKAFPDRDQPKIILCGGREIAFDKFKIAFAEKNAFVILLVDSEAPVGDQIGAWVHLSKQEGAWKRPKGATKDHAHLMVQCMESWFLADLDALAAFYGNAVSSAALPRNPHIEQIAKAEVLSALEHATRKTTKGKYHKTDHGPRLLGRICPQKIRLASPHAERLCKVLEARLSPRSPR